MAPDRDQHVMAESDREEELIESARRGDELAFERLMRRHSESVRSLIARFFRNRSMVDDLAQETFAKAYFGLSSFRNESPFLYWLKRIAVRLCLDEVRNRRTHGIEQREEIESIANSSAHDPKDRLEARLTLDQMLASLAPVDRMIVILLYGEGYSVAEIAGLTGLSQANVKVRAFRLRRRLRTLYAGGVV
jgi:RNA polymerase sigma-70 factor (ECF subfamily)